MSTQPNFEKIRNFYDNVSQANSEAWAAQTEFFERVVERNTACLKAIGEAQLAGFRELLEARTLSEGIDSGRELNEAVRENLSQMYEENSSAVEDLVDALRSSYLGKEKVTEKKAPKSKKAA